MRCEPIAHREDLICVIGLLIIFFIGTFCPTIKCWMSNYFQSAKSYFSPCAHSVATRLQNRPYLLLFSPLQALFQTTLAVKALCFASLLVLFFIFVSGNIFHQDGEQRAEYCRMCCPFLKDVGYSKWQQYTTCLSNGSPTVQPCSYLIISIPLVFEAFAPWPQVQWEDWKVISCHHVWTTFCRIAS